MSQGTFKKIGQSDKPMYGPRAMLVCGFPPGEKEVLMKLLDGIQLANVPVIFSTEKDGEEKLESLLARPDQSGRNERSGPARAIVLSGITESELHRILHAYRQAGLPRPLWATLTPYSESWTLSALIGELEQERVAMEKRKR